MPERITDRPGRPPYRLRLFVAGDAPNSRIARENLRRLVERSAGVTVEITIVDVLKDPQTALAQGVFLTPALQRLGPGPETMIFGNLSNTDLLATLLVEDGE